MTASTMPDTATASSGTTHRMAIMALAVGAFAVGTNEFMISALLRDVAADLEVSIPSAALLISGYAVAVALGGLTLPPTSIQPEGDSGGWFGRFGRGERRGLARSWSLSGAADPVAG